MCADQRKIVVHHGFRVWILTPAYLIFSLLCLVGCPVSQPEKSKPQTIEYFGQENSPGFYLVMEFQRDPNLLDLPSAHLIAFEDYQQIKDRFVQGNPNWRKGSALYYQSGEGDSHRSFHLELEAFDQDKLWLAEIMHGNFKTRKWVARYVLYRNSEIDAEFPIRSIIEDRSRVLGGIQYGMSVAEVLSRKGNHYKIHHHQIMGSADIVYDDLTISVRRWYGTSGKVVDVQPTSENMKQLVRGIPYQDKQ